MRTLSTLLILAAMAAFVSTVQAQPSWVGTGGYAIDDSTDGDLTDDRIRIGYSGRIGAVTWISGSLQCVPGNGEIGTGAIDSLTLQIKRGWGSLIMLGGNLDLNGTAAAHVYIGRENATGYIAQTGGTLRMGCSTKETFVGAPRTSGGFPPANNGLSEGYIELKDGLLNMRGYTRVGAYNYWKNPVTSGFPSDPTGKCIGVITQTGGTLDASMATGGGLQFMLGWNGGSGTLNVSGGVTKLPDLYVGLGAGNYTYTLTYQGNTVINTVSRDSEALLKIGKDANITANNFQLCESKARVAMEIELASLTDFSQINCTGAVDIGADAPYHTDPGVVEPVLKVNLVSGFVPTLGDEWIIATGSTVSIANGGFSAIEAPALSDPAWSYEVRVDDGNKLVLAVVPEPATLALLGLGGLALIRRRR